MKTEQFNEIIHEQISRSLDTLVVKAKEYATDDRLHNFKTAAALHGCTPEQALAGMMAKHTVSVYDMCNSGQTYPIELWNEKITDSINYLLILRALIEECRTCAYDEGPEEYEDEDFDEDDEDFSCDLNEYEIQEIEKAQAKRLAEGKPIHATGCKYAVETDQWHGWECEVTGGECRYVFPNSKACARDYGEGPDSVTKEEDNE